MKRKAYEAALEPLQHELVAAARWIRQTGQRIAVVVEGRDTAGKDGVIEAIEEPLSPRVCRVVALPKPGERERTQWWFQRYVQHLPAAGEMTMYDRSWYNRAGVEKVMGFADEAQVELFLRQAPVFEQMLVHDGILLFKYWLCCDQAMQEERLAERVEDPLKRWKLSDVDLKSRAKYDDYTAARDAMLQATHTAHAPWTLVDFNDQRRGRLTMIADLLRRLPDTHVPDREVPFPALRRKPSVDPFEVMAPIATYEPGAKKARKAKAAKSAKAPKAPEAPASPGPARSKAAKTPKARKAAKTPTKARKRMAR